MQWSYIATTSYAINVMERSTDKFALVRLEHFKLFGYNTEVALSPQAHSQLFNVAHRVVCKIEEWAWATRLISRFLSVKFYTNS